MRKFFINKDLLEACCEPSEGYILSLMFVIVFLAIFSSVWFFYITPLKENKNILNLTPTTIQINIGELTPEKISKIKQILEQSAAEKGN